MLVFPPASERSFSGATTRKRVALESWSWMFSAIRWRVPSLSSSAPCAGEPAFAGWPIAATLASSRARSTPRAVDATAS